MADLLSLSTMSQQSQVMKTMGIVLTYQSYSQRGIDHILPYTKLVLSNTQNITSTDQLNSKSSTTLFNKLPRTILLGPREINTLVQLRISEYHTGIGLLWLHLEKVSIPKVLGDRHLSV
jgi:hypothetical protein